MNNKKPTTEENKILLRFELYDDLKFFAIWFETVSEKRNLLTDVILEDFHLDTAYLQISHPNIYNKIKMKMERKAKDYWDKQINEIPTLAYQAKSILIALFLLFSIAGFSQSFFSGEAGNRLGINAGYNYNNVLLKAGALVPYTRTTTLSNITYAGLGYRFGFITPLVGIAHYHVTELKKVSQLKFTKQLCFIQSNWVEILRRSIIVLTGFTFLEVMRMIIFTEWD